MTYNNREKAKQTCLEKYGAENPMQNKEVEQRRDTSNMCLFGTKKFADNLEKKYGSAKYRNLEQAKRLVLENMVLKIHMLQNSSKIKLNRRV